MDRGTQVRPVRAEADDGDVRPGGHARGAAGGGRGGRARAALGARPRYPRAAGAAFRTASSSYNAMLKLHRRSC